MGELSVAEVLERAADLIEPEGAWTQRALARNAAGKDTGLSERFGPAVCYCVMGATAFAAADDEPFSDLGDEADHFFANFLGAQASGGLHVWNDAPERTQAEVVAALRQAALRARSQEDTVIASPVGGGR